MQEIVRGLYTFTGLMMGRVYALDDPGGITLVDASIAPAVNRILAQLRTAGHQPSDVKRILITHGHPDHVGGLPALKAATGALVYASSVEKPIIQGETPIPRPNPSQLSGISRMLRLPATTLKPTPVDREIGDGDVLPEVMAGMEVISTPGHAPGHVSFWQPERRILIVGDVIFNVFNGPRLPFAVMTYDVERNKESVRRLAALEPEVVCFGHGEPWTQNAAVQLRAFARKIEAA